MGREIHAAECECGRCVPEAEAEPVDNAVALEWACGPCASQLNEDAICRMKRGLMLKLAELSSRAGDEPCDIGCGSTNVCDVIKCLTNLLKCCNEELDRLNRDAVHAFSRMARPCVPLSRICCVQPPVRSCKCSESH